MEHQSNWWHEAIFYEIYLRSFQDSNGDGIGDLRGLIDRLDYLQDLGVDALWVCPFYESPHVDFGYDISNHTAVDPRYGTLADFQELVREADRRNLKIIVDIILNHTSDEHPLFIESRRSRNSPKRDWYIWQDPKPDGSPPNNWEGFEPSCWTYDEETQQYYYHFHYIQQPDLNWRNPKVIEEMFAICDFWLNQGVAGLRLDAINYLVEDPELRDNPIVEELPEYLRNIFQFNQLPVHTINHPDNHPLLQQMRQHIKTNHPQDPLLIGEIWVPTTQDIREFYGQEDNELQLPFNFLLSTVPSLSAVAFREKIQDFEENLAGLPTTVVLSNHDFPRSTTRYGTPDRSDRIAKLLATFLLTLRGIPFIYYGEELGMVDTPPDRLDEVQDPRGRLRWPEYKGRDGCRTPMQWNEQTNAGFTEGTPWYKIAPDYLHRNVAVQGQDPDSILNYYKQLIQLRRDRPSLRQGTLTLIGKDEQVLAYTRQTDEEQLLILLNMSPQSKSFSLPEFADRLGQILLSTHPEKDSAMVGETLPLMPFEGAIALLQH
ncbi:MULTISPECIES: alpha-glucosidase [Spirulina sp. CCY15215]|uniref:glycoside hydrolase family 13 protein n=1 Tax=Spirulina sp. CCY15215 TaxID=2767591 RepID=UPI0019513973|nr:alpha-glucosidase [Spirulina major]